MDFIEFSFQIQKNGEANVHSDTELFFLLDGEGQFTLEDKQYYLKKDDFLIINANQRHFFRSAGENFLAATLKISYLQLGKMLRKEMVFFICNTSVEETEITQEVRVILKKIVSEQYQNQGKNEIYLSSLYYELLYILTTDFLLNQEEGQLRTAEHKFDDRKYMIAEYVRQNYDKEISLSDLAEKLYLSLPYLSKYFKKQFGMNFIEYVNSVRLNYAVSQLLYSDKPLVRIAMDTGFASSAAFNKLFREKYHMTPTEYRGQWREKEMKQPETVEEAEKIQKQVSRFFQDHPITVSKRNEKMEEYAILDELKPEPMEKIWTKMINIGTASDLLHSTMQQHILYLKNTLHFRYVRFWDIYSDEILMRNGNQPGDYNFDKLDRILDFLTGNDLIPYMELRNKPKILIQNGTSRLQHQNGPDLRSDRTFLKEFMKRLIIHLINRYTGTEIEKWYFEVWRVEEEELENDRVVSQKQESAEEYLEVFDIIAKTMRQYLPNIRIGGGGFALRWGEESFREILCEWKKREQKPDFLTIYCYPYGADWMKYERSQTLDPDFVKKYLLRIREMMEETEFPAKELHVSECSFSVSSRNVLNDHCMKGAWLAKNIIDTIGLANLVGYWVGSDLFADFYDSRLILNGGGGLVSKDGIPKPSYYALEFSNHLGKYLLKTGAHYIITDNGKGNYRILCHNMKNLGYQYGLRGEDQHSFEAINNLFTDQKKNTIHFDLPAKKDGSYVLRMYVINQKSGSILDEWTEMSGSSSLTPEDVNYLQRITIPRLSYLICQEKNGKLRFDISMEPNEILFIHASFKYTE